VPARGVRAAQADSGGGLRPAGRHAARGAGARRPRQAAARRRRRGAAVGGRRRQGRRRARGRAQGAPLGDPRHRGAHQAGQVHRVAEPVALGTGGLVPAEGQQQRRAPAAAARAARERRRGALRAPVGQPGAAARADRWHARQRPRRPAPARAGRRAQAAASARDRPLRAPGHRRALGPAAAQDPGAAHEPARRRHARALSRLDGRLHPQAQRARAEPERLVSAGWLLAGTLALASVATPAAGGGGGAPTSDDALQIDRVRQIVARGHAWLIKQQNRDGSFSIERSEATRAAPVAVTALAALSLMAAGSLPDRGEHERTVRAAVDWLVDHCNEDGFFTTDSDSISRMHGHGYALLALTQACGMYGQDDEGRKRLRSAIDRGVHLIESSQGETGGWWYDPRKHPDHEGSVTVCMIQALRTARDAGFAVDKEVINRAVNYMKRSQEPSSGAF